MISFKEYLSESTNFSVTKSSIKKFYPNKGLLTITKIENTYDIQFFPEGPNIGASDSFRESLSISDSNILQTELENGTGKKLVQNFETSKLEIFVKNNKFNIYLKNKTKNHEFELKDVFSQQETKKFSKIKNIF